MASNVLLRVPRRRTWLLGACAVGALAVTAPRVSVAPAAPTAAPGATTLDCGSLESAILGRAVSYCVDLPSDYASSSARYPTLYFLHGLFEDERSWADRGGKEILDGLLGQGQLGKFIVVAPDAGKTFYVNSSDGKVRYEDFFIQELVPAMDKKYRTLARREMRAVSGTSMGGFGALHYGMRHPDVFSAASAQSAALVPKFPDPWPTEGRWTFYARVLEGPFGSPLNEAYFDTQNPLELAQHPETFAGLKLYFDVGDHDRYGFEEGNELLDKTLTAEKFPHTFALRPGGHGWNYLADYMKYDLEFHWQAFESAASSGGKRGKSN